MNQLPDWMYHAIEESFTCQFASTMARDIPVALPVFLNHFDPDTGTLILSSPVATKRVKNVRQRPKVAILFSPVGSGPGEPKHVLLAQGLAEVDDTNLMSGWKRYFAGWARRQPSARESLVRMEQAMPGYTQRALIRVRPTRFLGWPDGNFQHSPWLSAIRVSMATRWCCHSLSSLIGDKRRFLLPILHRRPVPASEEQVSLTLLHYDEQMKFERYLLCYGHLTETGKQWIFTPSNVVLPRWGRRA